MEEFFQDPITNELMENAVITPYGHSFSEESITQWIMRDHTCPITRQPLELKDLKPNFALRAAIDAYKKQQYAQQQQKLLKTIQNKKKASAAASSSSSSSASNSAPHAAPSAPHHHEHAAPREAASENDEETTEIAHAALPRPASHESIEDGYILVHNDNNSDVSSTDIVNAQLYRPLIADEQLYNVLASHWCGCGTSASHPQHRDMHLSPNIPQKKLMNAYATAGASGKYMSCSPYEWQHETIFAMLDCSIFGNGKDYVLFGRHGIYFYSWPSKPQFVAYRELITEEFKVRPRGSFFVDLGKDRLCSLAGTSMSPEKMVRIVNEIKEICKNNNNNNNNNSGSGGGGEEQFVVGDYRSVPFTPAALPSAATQLSEEFVAAFNEFRILHALTWFDSCDRFFKYPSIPPKRLKNAMAKLERANIDLDAHDILGLIDMSMFGNGKEAILFGNGNSSSRCGGGGGGIYVVSWPGDPRFISYESMLANDTQVTAQGDNVLIRRASRSTAASDNNNEAPPQQQHQQEAITISLFGSGVPARKFIRFLLALK